MNEPTACPNRHRDRHTDPGTRQITPKAYGRVTNRPAEGGSLSRHAYAGVEKEPALAEVKGRQPRQRPCRARRGCSRSSARTSWTIYASYADAADPGSFGPRDWRNTADAEMAPPVSRETQDLHRVRSTRRPQAAPRVGRLGLSGRSRTWPPDEWNRHVHRRGRTVSSSRPASRITQRSRPTSRTDPGI
jgi:hypothetical protein